MTKKMFDNNKLRTTVANQDKALQDRFDKADSILLKPSAATPEPVAKKSPVVRDTFSMPHDDYARIGKIRTKAAKEGHISTKSEVIRAGLQALDMLKGEELVVALNRLEKVTPGRKS